MAVNKRNNPNGTTFYEVRWWEATKKKSKSFERKIDAEQFERKQRVDQVQKELHPGWKQKFKEAAESWIARLIRVGVSPGWEKRAVPIVRNVLIPKFGEMRIEDIQCSLIEVWIAHLLKNGDSRQNANILLKVFKAILNYEVKMGRIPYNPVGKFPPMKEPRHEFKVWSPEEAAKFLSLMKDRYETKAPWVYRAYVVALNTGLRAGELWGLRWTDVMWNERLIKVEQTLERLTRELRIGTKSGKTRFVPLTDACLKALQEQKEFSNQSLNLVFSFNGRPVDHDYFGRYHWERDIPFAAKTLDIADLRFHDLRHTAATLMLGAKLQITEVQQILGHAAVTTTMRYVHLMGNQSAQKASSMFSVGEKGEGPSPAPIRHLKLV